MSRAEKIHAAMLLIAALWMVVLMAVGFGDGWAIAFQRLVAVMALIGWATSIRTASTWRQVAGIKL